MNFQEFTEKFQKEFNQESFYASPNRTKIFLKFGNDEQVIGNATVMNIEQLNEKIPIYSYNSSQYRKYLQGKEVVTGIIALRKVTVTQFLKLIKKERTKEIIENKLLELEKDIQKLKNITIDHNYNVVKSNSDKHQYELRGLNKIISTRMGELDTVKQLLAKKQYDISGLSHIFERSDIGTTVNQSMFESDDLLYYIETYSKNNLNLKENSNNAKINISFEGSFGENCPHISVKDVIFTRKQTEINIGKNDIIEVYSFIGNPG